MRGDPGLFRAQVTLQDARAWGVPSPTAILGSEGSTPSSTALYEGWVEARTSAARPAYLRIGRQAVTWGDGRLVSNADWSPVARTLDAVRGHASAGMFDFELLAAILDTPTPLGPAFAQTAGPASSGAELYGAQVAASAAHSSSSSSRFSRASTEATVAVDDGETYVSSLRAFGDAAGGATPPREHSSCGEAITARKLSAWAAAGYIQEDARRRSSLSDGSTRSRTAASGRSALGSASHAQFDPILPDVHELHGAMDLFAWSNTVQASARVTVVPWVEGRLAVEYRYVRLAEDGLWLDAYLDPGGRGRGCGGARERD